MHISKTHSPKTVKAKQCLFKSHIDGKTIILANNLKFRIMVTVENVNKEGHTRGYC